jgi:hypothetical protein
VVLDNRFERIFFYWRDVKHLHLLLAGAPRPNTKTMPDLLVKENSFFHNRQQIYAMISMRRKNSLEK